MPTNYKQFKFEVDLSNKVFADTFVVQKAAMAFEAMNLFVEISPIETGEFMSGWHARLNADSESNPRSPDPVGDAAFVIEAARPEDSIHIQDNVLHGKFLEMGSSQQAPVGVVAPTAQALESFPFNTNEVIE